MEQVLFNESRIPPRMTFLKPLSAAIAIGTGGPFGAEGPIIATGGALGSLARAGRCRSRPTSARRCSPPAPRRAWRPPSARPVSAVLLAVELLLFEYRPRSLIPVALASRRGHGGAHRLRRRRAGVRHAGPGAARAAPRSPSTCCSARVDRAWRPCCVTRAVYAVEDAFEKLPIHWMWWPALGARRGRRGRLLRAAHAGRRLRQHRGHPRRAARRARRCSSSALLEVRLLVHRARAAARRAARWRRSSPSAAGSGSALGGSAARWLPGLGRRPAHRRAGGHGGHVRRGLARAAGLGGVRLRDDAPAAGPAAAARRLHRGVSRLVRC